MLIHDALTHHCGVWAHAMGITSHYSLQRWEQTFPRCVQPQDICPGQRVDGEEEE